MINPIYFLVKVASSWILLLIIYPLVSHAQDQNEVALSVHFEQLTPLEALNQINEQSEAKLAFNPSSIPNDRLITARHESAGISHVLTDILGSDFELKYVGDYVIIQKKKGLSNEKQSFKISGGIKDAQTGEELDNVTIYEVNTLQSTLSDDEGEFELSVRTKADLTAFSISRKNYQDTIILAKSIQDLESSIQLKPVAIRGQKEKTIQSIFKRDRGIIGLLLNDQHKKNTENVKQVQEKYFQFSFVPAIGTNMTMGGQVNHRLSLNLLAGYSYGLNSGFELGGFYNIDRSHVSGCQVAGFGNSIGGEMHGVQLAGFINTANGYLEGTQIAGFVNVSADWVKGAQIAGFSNISGGYTKAMQLAGFNNHSGELDGAQMAGFINTAKKMDGFQLSGFYNHSGDMKGMQLSGFLNISRDMEGFQMTSMMNLTKTLKGVQLGIINYADSITDEGLQLGLINLGRKNGLFELALEHGDVIPLRVVLRSGVNRFYTALSAGFQPGGDNYWSYGIGFGAKKFLRKKIYFNPELHAHQISLSDANDHDELNLLNKLHLNLGYQFFKHLSISGGPLLNMYITTDQHSESGSLGLGIARNPFYDQLEENDTVRIQMWLGYSVALRF